MAHTHAHVESREERTTTQLREGIEKCREVMVKEIAARCKEDGILCDPSPPTSQVFNDPTTIPDDLRDYADLIKRCSQHAHESDRDRVVYLTIDEGAVQAGSSQRRGGLVSREVVRNGTSLTATPAHQHVECAGHTDQFESGVLLNDNVDDEMGTAYTLNWGGGGPADCALFRGEGGANGG